MTLPLLLLLRLFRTCANAPYASPPPSFSAMPPPLPAGVTASPLRLICESMPALWTSARDTHCAPRAVTRMPFGMPYVAASCLFYCCFTIGATSCRARTHHHANSLVSSGKSSPAARDGARERTTQKAWKASRYRGTCIRSRTLRRRMAPVVASLPLCRILLSAPLFLTTSRIHLYASMPIHVAREACIAYDKNAIASTCCHAEEGADLCRATAQLLAALLTRATATAPAAGRTPCRRRSPSLAHYHTHLE